MVVPDSEPTPYAHHPLLPPPKTTTTTTILQKIGKKKHCKGALLLTPRQHIALVKGRCGIQGTLLIFPAISRSHCRPRELHVYQLYGILSKIAVCVCTCAAAHTLQSLSVA